GSLDGGDTWRAVGQPPSLPRSGVAAPDVSGIMPALGVGGNLSLGTYHYRIVFVDSAGRESAPSADVVVQVQGPKNEVTLTGIPIGPPNTDTVARRIYRTNVDEETFHLVAMIDDNTTVSHEDKLVDFALNGTGEAAGGNLSRATYRYQVTFVDSGGRESSPEDLVEVELAALQNQVT